MIDEKVLIFEKIKGTAVKHLTECLEADIGAVSDQYQQQINDKIIEWVKANQHYFTVEEFREAYANLCQNHQMVYQSFRLSPSAIQAINEIDIKYDLDDVDLEPCDPPQPGAVSPKLKQLLDALKSAKITTKKSPRRKKRAASKP